MSHRYLLNISYIGTNFRGIQKNLDSRTETSTVQSCIELGLKKLSPINEPKLVLSSRTDVGVHAINSFVHVDLERKYGLPYNGSRITKELNSFFDQENFQIRIEKAEIVPDTFHARHSTKGRTYLYRLAIAKHEKLPEERKNAHIPIEELDRCYFVPIPKFDIDKARQAAELIKGRHDFRSFMGSLVSKSNLDHPFYALRDIGSITIEAGESTSNSFSKSKSEEHYNYWNIQISGRSFLYRQIRRIVSVILSVAQGRLSNRDVYEMLTIPSKHSWIDCGALAPAHGLYLYQVDYDSKDKEFPKIEPNSADDQISSVENKISQQSRK